MIHRAGRTPNLARTRAAAALLLAFASGSFAQTGGASPGAAAPASTPLSFELADQEFPIASYNGIAAGDIDGDGDLDVILSTNDRACSIWANDGTGKFSELPSKLPPASAVALGDADGDGDLDLAAAEADRVSIWRNDGHGRFRKGPALATPECSALAWSDLDGDGDLDLFAANWSAHPDQVFLNGGRGRFTDSGQRLGRAAGSRVSVGDVDGDGDPDVVVANNGEEALNAAELWLNDGKGFFRKIDGAFAPSNAYEVALADLDGDGDLDAFVANSSHGGAAPADKVRLNDGSGAFTDSGQSLGSLYSMCAAAADFDGDGDLDVFTGSWRAPPRFWINDGTGNLSDSGLRLASPNIQAAACGDFDGDGAPDVFAATNNWPGGDGRPRLWLNRTRPAR